MKQKPLFTVDGETLTTTLLPPVRFVVEDFLPQGLHLLAGASKIGKSWLALWLCLQVAKGEKVWDFPSRSGDVLYLCTDDQDPPGEEYPQSTGLLQPEQSGLLQAQRLLAQAF